MKFNIPIFFEKSIENVQVPLKSDKNNTKCKVKVKVKQYHYRPGQALRIPAG
jgi:hypothetical protein